jgi:hypothetical protein
LITNHGYGVSAAAHNLGIHATMLRNTFISVLLQEGMTKPFVGGNIPFACVNVQQDEQAPGASQGQGLAVRVPSHTGNYISLVNLKLSTGLAEFKLDKPLTSREIPHGELVAYGR